MMAQVGVTPMFAVEAVCVRMPANLAERCWSRGAPVSRFADYWESGVRPLTFALRTFRSKICS